LNNIFFLIPLCKTHQPSALFQNENADVSRLIEALELTAAMLRNPSRLDGQVPLLNSLAFAASEAVVGQLKDHAIGGKRRQVRIFTHHILHVYFCII
jgi:hypothetical protein